MIHRMPTFHRPDRELVEILLTRGLDFLSVNRMEEMSPGAMSRMHRFGNAVLSLTMRWLFRVEVKDSQSGMWIFRQEILPFLNLHAAGMAFSEEIKIEAFTRFRALEVPGAHGPHRTGQDPLLPRRVGQPFLPVLQEGPLSGGMPLRSWMAAAWPASRTTPSTTRPSPRAKPAVKGSPKRAQAVPAGIRRAMLE